MGFGRCAVLSGAEIRFINAAITTDTSPLLVLTQCHLVSPESHWKCLCVPSLHLPLSFSHSGNSLLLSCLLSLSLSFFLKSFADSASISLHPFVLDSFVSSVSLLFMFISHVVSVFVTLPSACAWQWHSQDRLSAVASQGYVKHEMRKEVSG